LGKRRKRKTARRAPRPVLKPKKAAIRVEDLPSIGFESRCGLLERDARRGCLSSLLSRCGTDAAPGSTMGTAGRRDGLFELSMDKRAGSIAVTAAEPVANSKRACLGKGESAWL
jgi:hypothetical protein